MKSSLATRKVRGSCNGACKNPPKEEKKKGGGCGRHIGIEGGVGGSIGLWRCNSSELALYPASYHFYMYSEDRFVRDGRYGEAASTVALV